MTRWAISVADTFLNELLNLPQTMQKRVSKSIKILETDPISAQGDAKKLKGYDNNIYRIRIGDYRLVYSFGQGWVKLLSVRKRDDHTYDIDLPDFETPPVPPDTALLEPQASQPRKSQTAKSQTKLPATSQPLTASPRSQPLLGASTAITTALPFDLTKSLLQR